MRSARSCDSLRFVAICGDGVSPRRSTAAGRGDMYTTLRHCGLAVVSDQPSLPPSSSDPAKTLAMTTTLLANLTPSPFPNPNRSAAPCSTRTHTRTRSVSLTHARAAAGAHATRHWHQSCRVDFFFPFLGPRGGGFGVPRAWVGPGRTPDPGLPVHWPHRVHSVCVGPAGTARRAFMTSHMRNEDASGQDGFSADPGQI